jgi:hypothetical protein
MDLAEVRKKYLIIYLEEIMEALSLSSQITLDLSPGIKKGTNEVL